MFSCDGKQKVLGVQRFIFVFPRRRPNASIDDVRASFVTAWPRPVMTDERTRRRVRDEDAGVVGLAGILGISVEVVASRNLSIFQ